MILHKTCPTCGSNRIHRVRKTLTRTAKGQSYRVPNLDFYECPECGEQVFSPEAMDKIETHRAKVTNVLVSKP